MNQQIWLLLIFCSSLQGSVLAVTCESDIAALEDMYVMNNGESWLWRSPLYGRKWEFAIPFYDPCDKGMRASIVHTTAYLMKNDN